MGVCVWPVPAQELEFDQKKLKRIALRKLAPATFFTPYFKRVHTGDDASKTPATADDDRLQDEVDADTTAKAKVGEGKAGKVATRKKPKKSLKQTVVDVMDGDDNDKWDEVGLMLKERRVQRKKN